MFLCLSGCEHTAAKKINSEVPGSIRSEDEDEKKPIAAVTVSEFIPLRDCLCVLLGAACQRVTGGWSAADSLQRAIMSP